MVSLSRQYCRVPSSGLLLPSWSILFNADPTAQYSTDSGHKKDFSNVALSKKQAKAENYSEYSHQSNFVTITTRFWIKLNECKIMLVQ